MHISRKKRRTGGSEYPKEGIARVLAENGAFEFYLDGDVVLGLRGG